MVYKLSEKEYEDLKCAWTSLLHLSTSLTVNHVIKSEDREEIEEAGKDVERIMEMHEKLNDMLIDHYISCKES